jgi:hypothetical protein
MIEVMKDEGGNVYKITHMGKDKLKKEGELPLVLKCDASIYRKSMEIIANHDTALAQHAGIGSSLMIFSCPLVSSSLIYQKNLEFDVA